MQIIRNQELLAKVVQLRVQDTPLQNQHRAITKHTDQVQHTTGVRVAEVLREVTEHLPLLQSQVIAQVHLREVAVAVTEAVEAVAEVAVHHTPEVRVVQEVLVVLVAEVVEVQVHRQEEDNYKLPP